MGNTRGSTSEPPGSGLGEQFGAALSVVVVFVVALSIPLESADRLGLSAGQTTGWILGVYAVPGVLGLLLSMRYRVPLLLTGNIFILILISRVGEDYLWSDLVGASLIAGVTIFVTEKIGVIDWLTRWLPPPIIYALLAGAVFPFVANMFSLAGDEPVLVVGSLAAFFLARRHLDSRVPPILPAVAVAIAISIVTGGFADRSMEFALAPPILTVPTFSVAAVVTLTPVLLVLITVQANAPSVVFLREQRYRVDPTLVTRMSGLGTSLGSFLGPLGVSLSLPATALVAGPDSGEQALRYRAAALAEVSSVLIGVLAGIAVVLSVATPRALLTTAIGIAVFGILAAAFPRITETGLLWGPIVTFVVAVSDLTLFGLSEFFWAIVLGVVVSRAFESQQWLSGPGRDTHQSDR